MAASQQPGGHGIPDWEDGWKKACEALHPDDKKLVYSLQAKSSDCLDDVLKEARTKRDLAISKRWKVTKADGTTVILRDVFEKLLSWVSRYTQVADTLANADPLHAGLPWGACRFLLQVSMSDMQAFGSLSEGIELVAGVAFRYQILENICSSAMPASRGDAWLSLRDCIIKVYTSILNYLANAIKYWSHSTAARMARSLFKDMDAEQQKLRLIISKTDEEAFRTANIFQYQDLFNMSSETQKVLNDAVDQLRGPILRIAHDVSEIQDRLQAKERIEVFRWLSSVPCESHHHESCKRMLEGTGKWLLENARFLDWQQSSASALFWLNGIPGSGKSKLTSIVIQALLQRQPQAQTSGAPLAYFYCSQKGTDPRTANAGEILRAILRQLTGCDARLALRGTTGQEFRQRKKEAEYKGAQILSLDIPETVAHVLAITEEDPVTIVLDALDEVDDSERVELFDTLEQIVQESQNVVKVFISSRRDGDIVERFEQCTQIRVDHNLIHHDIHRFVEHRVCEAITTKKLLRGKISSTLRDNIVKTLSEGAKGMFRWVELSIDMLSNSRRLSVEKDVRSKLGQLPETLKQQYAMIYQDIIDSEPSTASIARKTFSWILAAKRALSIKEFIAAVALDDDGYYHTDLDVSRVLDICRNLIVVVSTDGTDSEQSFQVAHLSVKDFLMGMLEYSGERIHTLAMLRCLQTFDPRSLVEKHFVPRAEDTVDDMQNYAIYLFKHAELSELTRSSSPLASIMKVFLFDERLESTPMLQEWTDRVDDLMPNDFMVEDSIYTLYFKIMRPRHYDSQQYCHHSKKGIDFISRYSLLSVLEILERDCELLREISSRYIHYPPLYVAVQSSNYAIAQWLLERSISCANEADKTSTLTVSLHIAVTRCEIALVDLLLKHGADPLARGNEGYRYTAWHGGCRRVNLKIFRSLLLAIERKCGVRPEYYSGLKFNWKTKAFFEVIGINWTEATVMLMEHGADVFSRDEEKLSSLQRAIICSNYSTIEMLLEAARQSSREVDEHKEATTAIAPFPTWVNSLDGRGRSALHRVKERSLNISHDNESILKLLLTHGADPNIRSRDGTTAIHVAASVGSSIMIRIFQKTGLNIEARADNGATALHAAAGGQQSMPSAVHYLIEQGLDPLDPDYEGRTSLHYAAMSCNATALKELCEDLTRIDRIVRLPGAAATPDFVSHPNTADCLSFPLQAFLNSTDLRGNTPFHFVGSELESHVVTDERVSQIEDTIRRLLEHGADINMRNSRGQTPILRLVDSYRDREYRPSSNIKDKILKVLLTQGADSSISDLSGLTPMHCAASKSSEWVELLVRAGADIDAKDYSMRTPLHLSSRSGVETGTRSLLQYYANPGARDFNQATPLHYAAQSYCRFSDSAVIRLLVEAKADVNVEDNSGSTPLHWAAKIGNAESVQELLHAGVDPNIVDNQGTTAMQVAASEASILREELKKPDKSRAVDFLRAWYLLYKASNGRNTEVRLGNARSRLQRSQSLILRTDQSWGDFSHVRVEEIARR